MSEPKNTLENRSLPKHILDGVNIHVRPAEEAAKACRVGEIKEIAMIFARRASEVLHLLSLPLSLLTLGVHRANHVEFQARAMLKTHGMAGWPNSDPAKAEINAQISRMSKEESPGKNPVDEADRLLANLLEDRELVEPPVRALLYSGCVSCWSLFECAMRDAWVAAINSRPLRLAQAAIASQTDDPEIEGISGKYVSVGLLAKHSFDLRGCLGTLLVQKFDFTGVSGIRKAFRAAFGNKPNFDQFLSDNRLSRLEATRHLIVHRAGLVDDEYIRRTQDAMIKGIQLPLTTSIITELANVAVVSGSDILLELDSWLVENPDN